MEGSHLPQPPPPPSPQFYGFPPEARLVCHPLGQQPPPTPTSPLTLIEPHTPPGGASVCARHAAGIFLGHF